jgi:glyoxylase-like metal-dependent hydrolase (beta-lactamase superfamily II)
MSAAVAGGPAVRAFFDGATNTVTYLVWDPAAKRGAVVDPVLDWDNRSGEAGTRSADAVLRAAEAEGVALDRVLEPTSTPTT